MKNLILGILILLLLVFSNEVKSQDQSIPLCDKVEVVDVELNKKLGLFTKYEGFQQALVYKAGDEGYTLEIIYKPKNIFKVERKPITKAELDELCKKINNPATNAAILLLDQSGRREYLISSTISGLGFYAWAIPRALNIENERPFIASYMLIGGGSFYAPFLLTRSSRLTKPMARAYSIGTATGIGHGFLLKGLLDVNDESLNEDPFNRRLFLPISLGLTESFLLFELANKKNYTLGNVGMIATGSVWGAGWGASLGQVMTNEDESFETGFNKVATSALIGSGLGMFLGHQVYKKVPNISNGDVLVANAYGVLGALYAATLTDLVINYETFNDSKILLSSMTATSIAGIGYGLYRSRNFNYSTSEGAYVGLGEIAGGLLGVGIGYLIFDDLESEQALVSTSLGATAGLLMIDRLIRNRSVNVQSSIGSFDFSFNPVGIANAFDNGSVNEQSQLQQMATGSNNIVSMRMTF